MKTSSAMKDDRGTAEPNGITASERLMKTDDAVAWRQLAAGVVIMFLSTGIIQTFTFLFESTRQQLGIEITMFTWAFNVGMTVQFIVCLGVCKALIHLDHRFLLASGGLLVALGVLLCRFASAPWHLFICFSLLVGCGTGITTQTAYLLVNVHFDAHRGLAIGILYSTAPIARMILPFLEDYLEEAYGSKGALLIMSGVLLHMLPAAMCIRAPKLQKKISSELSQLEHSDAKRQMDRIKVVASKPIFWIFLTADSFFWLLFPNFTMLLPIYTSSFLNRAQSSWLFTFTGCGDILARLIFPPLVDRRWLLPRNGYVLGNIFGMIAAGLSPFAKGSFVGMGISSLLFGIGSGISVCFGGLVLLQYFGLENLPASTGFGWAIKGIVLLAFGPAIGGLRELTGDFSASYFLLSAGMALGSLIWLAEPLILLCRRSKAGSFSPSVVQLELSEEN